MEILYGRNPILESLRAARRTPRRLFLARDSREGAGVNEILRHAHSSDLEVERVSRHELSQLVGHRHHQAIALETGDYPYSQTGTILATAGSRGEPPLLLLLDLLQDPQNVGALLRTAEAVGVHGVFLQKRRAVGVTPAVVSSSSGATEHLLIAQETNLPRTMRDLKTSGVWLYGLDAGPDATPLQQIDLAGPIGLVVGSEGRGLRRLVRETCDALISLPMRGRVESLNAAVAGSVLLYAVWERRGFGTG
jgi:23S rRNA (guanosine2251-2'-O)-methyltransferase